jgi:methylglutamate dehydrogenase subunit C
LSRGPARIAPGLLTDAARPIAFRFDGRALRGLAGDTLASALLANGQRLVGRSFKYHRPRGIVSAGPEEPCALVDVLSGAGREPNQLATTLALHAGLAAVSQNRWPSLAFDVMAVSDRLSRFLPAGFYYKTFMSPAWAWERLYEPLVRRAAGLGVLRWRTAAHAEPAETLHEHVDVLVVGAGPAGLAAAAVLGASGLRVLLADQDVAPGGGALLDARWDAWRVQQLARLSQLSTVRLLTRTTVLGAYGHGVLAALEVLGDEARAAAGGVRERLRVIRAQRVLLSSGATERLIAFPGNDVPGVMLCGAALAYLRRYGVAVGRRPALFVNNDEAYEALFALHAAGIACAGVVDVRAESRAAARARGLGVAVLAGAAVEAVRGRTAVRSVCVRDGDGARRELAADCLLISGGFTPAASLATQLGATLQWHEESAAFVPELPASAGRAAGAARGVSGLAAAARDGAAAASALLAGLHGAAAGAGDPVELPPDPEHTPLAALWEVEGRGKAFVDLQNDVTRADVRLSQREGYEHVEHMKRYTTHGMATDQGRIGGLLGSAILARARGVPVAAVGQANPRPYVQPVPFAALAGCEVREHYKPIRRLPLHDWHAEAGATFVPTGLWLRPLVYSGERGWEPVLREARAVRRALGITDVSTLGKIDVQGKDAARFLDFIYANTFSTLAVGRARYGIMLREDGMLFDDGTTSRLGPEHFLVTTTTANSAAVLEHLEFHRQATCAHLDVVITDVADQWAQFAVAGPRARELLRAVCDGRDLSNEAFPFMAAGEIRVAQVAGRLFRISFSGELAYEIAVPATAALRVWSTLLQAGRALELTPYGLDALNTLRIEKGHVTGAELNGNTGAHDLGFERLLKKQGDFIGRTLAQRPALTSAERLQLVGVRPKERAQRLRNGMQLVSPAAPSESLGYVTSSTPSVELEGWVGLALLAGGRARIGSQLIGTSPLHGERIELEVLSPHMLDPENHRVRA